MAFLGLGAGKMDLILNKSEYHPREIIEGTAVLTVKETLKARGVIATIDATR